jgi:hypothetical protein
MNEILPILQNIDFTDKNTLIGTAVTAVLAFLLRKIELRRIKKGRK